MSKFFKRCIAWGGNYSNNDSDVCAGFNYSRKGKTI